MNYTYAACKHCDKQATCTKASVEKNANNNQQCTDYGRSDADRVKPLKDADVIPREVFRSKLGME